MALLLLLFLTLTLFPQIVTKTLERWTPEEDSRLISMRRQGMVCSAVAKALGKTERAVSQRYLKLVPTNNPRKKSKADYIEMSEEMKIKLLAAVARRKNSFWQDVAKEVGGGVTGPQCEVEWTDVIRSRGK